MSRYDGVIGDIRTHTPFWAPFGRGPDTLYGHSHQEGYPISSIPTSDTLQRGIGMHQRSDQT